MRVYNKMQTEKELIGMDRVVYADLLFLIDMSMDFLCLYITSRILHRNFRIWRCLGGAALGGAYSVIALIIDMNFWLGMSADVGVCALICLAAFGCRGKGLYEYVLCSLAFFGVSAALGGFMTAIFSILNIFDLPLESVNEKGDGISVWLFGALAVVSGLWTVLGGDFFKRACSTRVVDVDITYRGNKVALRAFIDTGNLLTDPLTGRSVILIDNRMATHLIGHVTSVGVARGSPETMDEEDRLKLRFIPVSTAAGENVLYAFAPENVTVTVKKNGKHRKTEVAALFAPSELKLSADKTAMGCNALISQDILV